MAGPGLQIPTELNKIHHDEGYPLDLESYYDITMENLRLWIPENIQKKECVYFIESSQLSDSGKVACECGYLREEHLEEAIKPVMFQGKEWDPRRHYVRVSSSTSPKTLYQLITQYWGLDIPNLLISVTGGAKNFGMKMRLKNIFRQGLAKVVQTTGAWIITGGSHTGVMKQVGEALQDFIMSSTYKGEIVVIGIASWGTVHNRNSLICRTEAQGSLSCLDSNHSHFILVDDGTHGKYGVEIPLRTKLEKYISEQTKVKGGVAIKIPIVCVVLEGGPGTLDTIYNAINNGTPCVIVEGSGRVADVIAQVSNLPSHKISICLIQKKLSIFFKDSYELFTENKIVEWTKKIQDIVRNKQLLTIFREGKDGQQDIDVAILQAMLKASRCHDHFGHENWDYQLKLAVAWNRVDIARSEIFTEDHEWKPFDLHPMMAAALIANKPEFVKLFLEQGIQLKEFVTWDTLLYLYENMATSSVFHGKLQKVLLEEKERAAISKMPRIQLHHVSQVLRELLGDFTQQLYPKLKNTEKHHLPIPMPQNKVQGVHLQAFYKRSAAQAPFSMDPVRDLLIWAIVQNRKELADIIWTQSRDCIAAALACSNILKEISKEENDTDSSEEMLILAEKYEHRAVGVFTECYRKDEERAQNLLIRISDAWGKTTCLQLALEGKNMKFVSHGGVQAFLTRVWWGKLSVDNGICQVILCMLFFPLLYTGLIIFRKKRIQPTTGLNRFQAFFTAPVVIFHLNILSYFSFLCLFAFVLMTDFQSTPSWPEYVIYFWLFSLVCEEARQLFCDPDGFGLVKMASLYFSDFWNKLDACAILIFIVGLVCRNLWEHRPNVTLVIQLMYVFLFLSFALRWFPATLYPGRIVLSLAFIIFCLRLLHIFTISKTLGPKIIIVKRMVRVNFNFDQCSPNGTDPYKPKCPESSEANKKPIFPEWLTVILLCLYLLFTNILLLNLLIAMFNYTFQQVQEHTDQIWKFQRHDLIEEYNSRPPAPPPFILLNHLQIFVKCVFLQKPTTRHKQLKKKFEKNEEAALLSWEMYLKENYLQLQKSQQKHTPEQKIQHITDRVDKLTEMLDLDQEKMMKLLEQRLLHLEEQTFQFAKGLQWIVQSLSNSGFGTEEDIPVLVPSRAAETKEQQAEEVSQSLFILSHVSSRNLLYPKSTAIRFPVPDEKVPWETEFDIYNPPFYSSETQEDITPKFLRDNLENLSRINFNSLDGEINRQSFHGTYTVEGGLPLNPMGRTGLRGQGILRFFGPNHALHPVVTRWRRNVDGSIFRKNLKKMLEVLVVNFPSLDNWALLGGSLEPGEALPQKIKQVLRREFWPQFQKLLNQGTE
ncbi:Transient receptor potential cation channel subfamily M member 2, partial [Ophiophagus hannah]